MKKSILTVIVSLLCCSSYAAFNAKVTSNYYREKGKEGFNFNILSKLQIDTLMGEPVIKSNVKWDFNLSESGMISVSFVPYGESELISISISTEEAASIQPYDFDLKVDPDYNKFIQYNPGAISKVNQASFNTPSSLDWNDLFFIEQLAENKHYYSKEESIATFKAINNSTKDIWLNTEIIDVKFNLSEIKKNYAQNQLQKRKDNYFQAAKMFFDEVKKHVGYDDNEYQAFLNELKKLSLREIAKLIDSNTIGILNSNLPSNVKNEIASMREKALDYAKTESKGIQDCKGDEMLIDYLYNQEKEEFENFQSDKKKNLLENQVQATDEKTALTEEVATLINNYSSTSTTYSANMISSCVIKIEQRSSAYSDGQPVLKTGLMNFKSAQVKSKESSYGIRIEFLSKTKDFEQYLSGNFNGKTNKILIAAFKNNQINEITDDILKLKDIMPKLNKLCKE